MRIRRLLPNQFEERIDSILPSAKAQSEPAADSPEPAAKPESDGTPSDAAAEPAETEPEDAARAWVSVNVAGDYYGHQAGTGRRRRSGELDDADVQEALRWFVDPPGLSAALADLLDKRVTVLAGRVGTGRRSAAIALLTRALPAAGTTLVELPPTLTIGELADYAYVRGRGYLLLDFTGSEGRAHEFDADQLRRRLDKREAHLVMTTSEPVGRQHLSSFCVDWVPASGSAVIEDFLQNHGPYSDDDRRRLLDACANALPGHARQVVDTLLNQGVEAAVAATATAASAEVRSWFDGAVEGRKPRERAIIRVAVGALLPLSMERDFETAVDVVRSERAALRGEPQPEPGDELPEDRAELRAIPLLRTDPVEAFGLGRIRSRVRPCSAAHHEAILTEVVGRFGSVLLDPLAKAQYLAASSDRSIPQLCAAFGLAQLAKVAPEEAEPLLEEWSVGLMAQRRAAAFALSFMCEDDRTAALALRTATDWCDGQGARRAATAATAFGLELGRRYASMAVLRLWDLALRGTAVNPYARRALVVLFRGSDDDPRGITDLLRALSRQMRQLLAAQVPDHRRLRCATDVLLELVTAPALTAERSMTAHIVQAHPQLVGQLAELWGEVLRSLPHRQRAITKLRADLNALTRGADDDAVTALGEGIRRILTDEEWTRLRRDLPGGSWQWSAPRSGAAGDRGGNPR